MELFYCLQLAFLVVRILIMRIGYAKTIITSIKDVGFRKDPTGSKDAHRNYYTSKYPKQCTTCISS